MNKIKNNQLEYPSTLWINSIDDTPLGTIWIAISEKGLAAVEMGDPDPIFRQAFVTGISIIPENNRTCVYLHQLNEYLQGKRRQFDFAIDWSVLRSFQALALRATFEIPYGKTASYGEIATHIGNPRAARAVGRAEATNPMPLVIPCHRVIAANGELGGYGGKGEEGLRKKRWLLDLEKNS